MNTTNEKTPRKQKNRFDIKGAIVSMVDVASGRTVASWDMDKLPDPIKERILGQGGSTILQQRKSGKEGQEALDIMNAHYSNWMTNNWEMERKTPRALPAWVFPALCLKMPQVAPAKILAALESKRNGATDAEWSKFLADLQPYKEQLEKEKAAPEDDDPLAL